MKTTTVGIDLAKNVFVVHGVDERGKPVLRKSLKRAEVAKFFAKLEPCLIGMEACGSAHFWARKRIGFGHTVKLMAPQFVKPYVKTNKNDARDAEAICEAVARPNMRFVPVKTTEQQAVLALHRARQGFVKARTAQANQIRGLLAEFGITMPQGVAHVGSKLPDILEDGENGLPGSLRQLFVGLLAHFKELDRQVDELERKIKLWHRENDASCKLERIPGIGPITASALVASVGDARSFKNARQLAAWLGLVPRQRSSGGKYLIGHQQARRRVSAHAIDSRGTFGTAATGAACRSDQWVACTLGCPAQPERRCSGACQQERADRLGIARAWTGLSGRSRCRGRRGGLSPVLDC